MKKNLRKVLSALLLSSVLVACNGDGDTSTEQAGAILQPFQNFAVSIPGNWRKIFKEDFSNTIPEETVALFLHRIEGQDFVQNVNVVKESLNTDASSLEYAKANVLLGSKALIDYRALSSEEVVVNNVKTVIHRFLARNATTEPLRHYTQGYFARDQIGYTVTCIAQNEIIVQQETCTQVIRSFQFQ